MHNRFCLCQDLICLFGQKAGPHLDGDADGSRVIRSHQLCLHSAGQKQGCRDQNKGGQHNQDLVLQQSRHDPAVKILHMFHGTGHGGVHHFLRFIYHV